jgi:hypothetical protein
MALGGHHPKTEVGLNSLTSTSEPVASCPKQSRELINTITHHPYRKFGYFVPISIRGLSTDPLGVCSTLITLKEKRMSNSNKHNLLYFEADTMKRLYETMKGWQQQHEKRLLQHTNIQFDSGKFCCICIVLSNPTEVL